MAGSNGGGRVRRRLAKAHQHAQLPRPVLALAAVAVRFGQVLLRENSGHKHGAGGRRLGPPAVTPRSPGVEEAAANETLNNLGQLAPPLGIVKGELDVLRLQGVGEAGRAEKGSGGGGSEGRRRRGRGRRGPGAGRGRERG